MDRNCGNCAYGYRFHYSEQYPIKMIRCYNCDREYDNVHVITEMEGEMDVCGNHKTEDEYQTEERHQAQARYLEYKSRLLELEAKYPEFKKL